MTTVDTETDPTNPPDNDTTHARDPVPSVVDWVIGGLAAVLGLFTVAAGAWLFAFVDREFIADIVTAENVEVNGITPSEAITAGVPFVDWVAVGTVVSGVALVGGAAVFVQRRRATRRRVEREGGTTATFWASAVYGAAVTLLTSFVPFSTAVGGGAAAYLHGDDDASVRVGATSGAILGLLSAPLVIFLSVGLLAGADAIGHLGGGVLLAGGTLFAMVLGAVFNAGVGALGGWVVKRWV